MRSLFDTTVSTATFSSCRRYRYTLTRTWDHDIKPVNFLMLNPSTADEEVNDPTVERCERRARSWGYGGLIVTNIFAWRDTDPELMKAQDDPIGPDNDVAILESARRAGLVVCAWGNHGEHMGRGAAVREMLRGLPLHYLKISKSTGQPWHPLYIGYSVKPTTWEFP